MQKITINGIMYLGDVKEKEGKITITNAMEIEGVDKSSLSQYMMKKNLKELDEIEFSGMGTSVSKSNLNDEEELMLDICERTMKYASKKAEGVMINQVFQRSLGK